MFAALKATHVASVIITLGLFLLRSVWAFRGSPKLRMPLMRWLPHANDTVLLLAALATAAALGQYPFVNGWLTAKFFALILYIVAGHVALWRCRDNGERLVATAAALAVFGYILLVARCHDPLACFGGPV
jgi:uncharacterized membrane protein SirB2